MEKNLASRILKWRKFKMKRQNKKVEFYTLNKGNRFWDYVGDEYHQFVRCDDVEEKDVDVWNAIDIETGDFFHYDFDDVIEIS